MQLTKTLAASLLFALAVAAPAPAPEAEANAVPEAEALERRVAFGTVYELPNYGGTAWGLSGTPNTCYTFAAALNNKISSSKLLAGKTCTFWDAAGCASPPAGWSTSGSKTTWPAGPSPTPWIDNRASSWKCW